MSCYFCQKENRTTQDSGNCYFCGKAVCTPPPIRLDGIFHGDECKCGCDRLICDPHMSRHSRSEHSSEPFHCFPNAGFFAGTATLAVAGTLLSSEQPPELKVTQPQIETMSRLLIAMIPGAVTLAQVLGGPSTESWTWDYQSFSKTNEALINFRPSFFKRKMVEGIFLLAARVVGAVIYQGFLDKLVFEHLQITDSQVKSLLSSGYDMSLGYLTPEIVLPWLPEPSSDRSRSIVEDLGRLVLPWEPEQVALWIEQTDSGTSRGRYIASPEGRGVGGAAVSTENFQIASKDGKDGRRVPEEEAEVGTETIKE